MFLSILFDLDLKRFDLCLQLLYKPFFLPKLHLNTLQLLCQLLHLATLPLLLDPQDFFRVLQLIPQTLDLILDL